METLETVISFEDVEGGLVRILYLSGSILAFIWIIVHTESSFGDMITYASEQDKFNIAKLDFNFTDSTHLLY